jgi:adenine-specific DNA methylase
MTDFSRLIEHAFPLKQTSLDSVHEKNVRHGHISTLHIWPARRPLAACRAALIATLLPDPGTPEKRRELCEKIAGKVVKRVEKKKMPNGQIVERIKEETEGGILHWGRETENADTLEWFRREIRKAYGGRAPKVLDPFAGGGAIPLEAMRLGCEATAVDINPVAWFILKCTLEYPQKLAGQKRPLPAFILDNEDFMEAFYKANPDAEGKGKATKKQKATLFAASKATHGPDADLAWHVRAWGQWVLDRARKELAELYPTYADFEPVKKDEVAYEHKPMMLVPLKGNGVPDIESLNADSSADYLAVKANPRWIAKPTVAYLWARTVKCKNCRIDLPLLKTRWLCKKDRKRVLLTMVPTEDKTGVAFGIQTDVPVQGGNAAQKREHDKRLAGGTMSRAGAKCPCCPAIMTMEDIRVEGKAGRLGTVMTAVVVDTPDGKEYRIATTHELNVATPDETSVLESFEDVPFGIPDEPTPSAEALGMRMPLYGFDKWRKLFTSRQLKAVGTFVAATRKARSEMATLACPPEWVEAIYAGLSLGVDRIVDRQSTICRWDMGYSKLQGTFTRFALPMTWDFCEGNPFSDTTGNYAANLEWVAEYWEHSMAATAGAPTPVIRQQSAIEPHEGGLDAIVTDPPYYNSIPYSDLMDFFYIWLRRTLHGISPVTEAAFSKSLGPKWDHDANDGELIDDSSRHGNHAAKSKQTYEDGMGRVFESCCRALKPEGLLVVVFAHKHPDAWETIVSAMMRAGFVVDGSWPIQTEMGNRTRALTGAALASSVWLVCKKRPVAAKVGWDTGVLEEMRANIAVKLQAYWDAGIRGPDFIWAATGPALEAYSKHPAVKKADQPGQVMTVSEFLNNVRRLVVDYVVGKVLSGEQDGAAQAAASDRLDEPTAYYLLHRHDFGLDEAPVGTCILYAVSCSLSDSELVHTWDILAKTGTDDVDEDEAEVPTSEDGEEEPESTGGKVRLKTWSQRKNRSMGYDAPNGRSVPLIDRVHRLMHLWKAGDVHKVDEYLDEHGMRRHELFKRLVQSLIELSEAGSDERSLLESLSNHIGAKGTKADAQQMKMAYETEEDAT